MDKCKEQSVRLSGRTLTCGAVAKTEMMLYIGFVQQNVNVKPSIKFALQLLAKRYCLLALTIVDVDGMCKSINVVIPGNLSVNAGSQLNVLK